MNSLEFRITNWFGQDPGNKLPTPIQLRLLLAEFYETNILGFSKYHKKFNKLKPLPFHQYSYLRDMEKKLLYTRPKHNQKPINENINPSKLAMLITDIKTETIVIKTKWNELVHLLEASTRKNELLWDNYLSNQTFMNLQRIPRPRRAKNKTI